VGVCEADFPFDLGDAMIKSGKSIRQVRCNNGELSLNIITINPNSQALRNSANADV